MTLAGGPKKTELRILTPIGMLGYGFGEDIFWHAVEAGVDAIILDSGSTDSGPQKLALGTTTCSPEAYRRDLSRLVLAVHSHRVPLLIGSAGGDGSNQHTDMIVEIIEEIIKKNEYRSMKVLSIYADIPKDAIHEKLEAGEIRPCGPVHELTKKHVDDATVIVAQMGPEPYVRAMEEHPDFDIIVGGRSYDPAPYVAFCLHNGFKNVANATFMAKIMECGAQCSIPKSKEALAIVRQDNFDMVPLDPRAKFTPLSVASHLLYEKSRPDILLGPGGALHLADATYDQLPDNRSVRVQGGKFVPEPPGCYTIKLEGARTCGYHSMFFGGMRDPILISQLDQTLDRIHVAVKEQMPFEYDLKFHVYGKDGVMGALEPDIDFVPKEVAICGQVRAATQALATHVVNLARIYCIHAPYVGQLATAGNFAMPFAPYDIPMGPLTEFCVYHLMEVQDPCEHFPVNVHMIESSGTAPTWEVPAVYRRPIPIRQHPNAVLSSATTSVAASPVRGSASTSTVNGSEGTPATSTTSEQTLVKRESSPDSSDRETSVKGGTSVKGDSQHDNMIKEIKAFQQALTISRSSTPGRGNTPSRGNTPVPQRGRTPVNGIHSDLASSKVGTLTSTSTSISTSTSSSNTNVTTTAPSTPRKRKYVLTPTPAPGTCYLGDLASVLRSKNAGPFELTFDIMFDRDDIYDSVKESGALTTKSVARMYNLREQDVTACLFWDPARAFKATIRRPTVSGSFGDADVHASQQHIPFLYLVLPFPRP